MALVQLYEMDSIIIGILMAIRKKAAEFDLSEGAIAICCSDDDFSTRSRQISCFGLLPGEENMRIFPLRVGGSFVLQDDETDCLGVVAAKIAAAKEAYIKEPHSPLTSRECTSENIPGRQNLGGCVTYPLKTNGHLCGLIYVAVCGGTERQDELCAWEAYEPIKYGLVSCATSNPGRDAYAVT